jgi:anti-sigma B factor antagonist
LPSDLPLPPCPERISPVTQPLFEIEIYEGGDEIIIHVKGEFDLAVRPHFDRVLAESEARAGRRILLELDELTFIDAAGLYALDAASARSAENGSRMRMSRGRGDVATILRLTSLDRSLPFIEVR